jgi:hypothetical protein
MEKLFTFQKIITRLIFIVIALFIFGIFYRIFINESGKSQYIVTSPSGESHITTYILEKNGCAIFYDEFNIENRICGSYTIKKL